MMIKTISTIMLKNNCAPDTGWSHRIKFQNRFSGTAVSNSRRVTVNKHGSNLSVWDFKYCVIKINIVHFKIYIVQIETNSENTSLFSVSFNFEA